ncbi:MAG: hypothetical protein ACI8RP_001225, partial [Urechidicola sp.]
MPKQLIIHGVVLSLFLEEFYHSCNSISWFRI